MIEIYHNPRCSKSRETLQLLEDQGIKPVIVEYLKDTPTRAELEGLLGKLGIPAEKLLRKGEAIFKEKFKGKQLSEEQWVSAMLEYPKLIERPIVVNGTQARIGRPPTLVLEIV
jgi:arsenate reductase (glutaredoxin)